MGLIDSIFGNPDQVAGNKQELRNLLESMDLKIDEHFIIDDNNDIHWCGPESEQLICLLSYWEEYGGENIGFFSAHSPAIKIPKENCLAFYRRLLEINAVLPNVSIAIDGDTVFINSRRPIENLDKTEIIWIMQMVDRFVNFLRTDIAIEFHAPLWIDE